MMAERDRRGQPMSRNHRDEEQDAIGTDLDRAHAVLSILVENMNANSADYDEAAINSAEAVLDLLDRIRRQFENHVGASRSAA